MTLTLFRLVAGLAVVAVLWRLGDAACGCAAHNHWVEAFVEHHAHTEADHEEHSHSSLRIDHGCEGANGSTYVSTTSSAPPVPDVSALGPAPVIAEAKCASVCRRPRPQGEDAVERPSTGKLRAELQIQLI